MAIPPKVLAVNGHPKRGTRKLLSLFLRWVGGEVFSREFARIRRHRDIRAYCLTCVEGEAEVRFCTTVQCPFWPYRMGRNPHNPRRGTNPFKS